ncbi:MFS transporter [Prauserella muralis]|uniref:MFS transporter n=1 Tax=Prauserella muralis TaxID=588067 RepID=A0A2V4BB26_9PSEU|nr:MFS transporter [Prauserella muralis]PXY32575.1 MFS transporter [Prauserella muralis]TWE23710.1 EmrB/QacA subfamily drug resistance transporter [Prauserella muralis]
MTHGHGHGGSTAVAAPARPGRWIALTLLCLAQAMLVVDITVVQVALPSIGADLDLDRAALTWVVTTYTVCFGGLMVLGGRIADVLGARRTLVAGLTLFTAASLVCGLAADGAVLIGGRAAQGVGAALLSPAALALITRLFEGAERVRALGIWAAIGGGGAAVGVLLSGLLTAGPGWEWVFFVNLPVGVAVLAALPAIVPRDAAEHRGGEIDVPGGLVVTAATALLIYGLTVAGDEGWTGPATLVALAAAVAGYALFAAIERGARTPLLRLRTLGRRPVVSGMFVMLVASGLMLTLFFLGSLYLQHTLRLGALETGLLFLPVAVAVTAGAHLGARLVSRIGGRTVAVAGFGLVAVGAALLTQVGTGDNAYAALLPGFLVAVLGIGAAFVTATSTTLANVPPGEAGVASGAVNTFHEVGGGVGVAAASTVAASSIAATTEVSGFADGYLLCAVAAAVAAVVSLVLVPAGRTAAVTGHGH